MASQSLATPPDCPECGRMLFYASVGVDTNPKCPLYVRWLAVRPELPSGIEATGRTSEREDAAWFAANPQADERVRPLRLDEQMVLWAVNGTPVTHVRVRRDSTGVGAYAEDYW